MQYQQLYHLLIFNIFIFPVSYTYCSDIILPSFHLLFILPLLIPILFTLKFTIFFFIQFIFCPHQKGKYSLSLSFFIYFFWQIFNSSLHLWFRLMNFGVELYFGLIRFSCLLICYLFYFLLFS